MSEAAQPGCIAGRMQRGFPPRAAKASEPDPPIKPGAPARSGARVSRRILAAWLPWRPFTPRVMPEGSFA